MSVVLSWTQLNWFAFGHQFARVRCPSWSESIGNYAICSRRAIADIGLVNLTWRNVYTCTTDNAPRLALNYLQVGKISSMFAQRFVNRFTIGDAKSDKFYIVRAVYGSWLLAVLGKSIWSWWKITIDFLRYRYIRYRYIRYIW